MEIDCPQFTHVLVQADWVLPVMCAWRAATTYNLFMNSYQRTHFHGKNFWDRSSLNQWLVYVFNMHEIRAAFKFGRRVHFALWRKMLKWPIARLSAMLLDFINHSSGETDCINEANVKRNSTGPSLSSIPVNSKHEWRKKSWKVEVVNEATAVQPTLNIILLRSLS